MSNAIINRLEKLFREADALKLHSASLRNRLDVLEEELTYLRDCVRAADDWDEESLDFPGVHTFSIGCTCTRCRYVVARTLVTLPPERE